MFWKKSVNKNFREKLEEHIKLREGYKETVYLDTLNKPTVGTGHLLTIKERKKYPVGTKVDSKILEKWLRQDLESALSSCNDQCMALKIYDTDFKISLTSVNFQLGSNWYKKFPKTWKALCDKDYDSAIAEITYKIPGEPEYSDWYKQTPTRVKDFSTAIEKIKEEYNG